MTERNTEEDVQEQDYCFKKSVQRLNALKTQTTKS